MAHKFMKLGLLGMLLVGCAHTRAGHAPTTQDFLSAGPSATRVALRDVSEVVRGVSVRIDPNRPGNTGVLTERGIAEAKQFAAELASLQLAAEYGCPGCDDHGLTEFELRGANGSDRKVQVGERPEPGIPEQLARAERWATGVRLAVQRCSADALVSIDRGCTAQP